MKKTVFFWKIAGFIFVLIFGTLLHFVYDWSGKSLLLAPFSAVNESIWEHTKLLFVPTFIFALIEYRYIGRQKTNFWCAKLAATVVGLLLIPVLYYTYTGALGVYADWFNIAIFFIAAAVYFWVDSYALKLKHSNGISPKVAFAVLCAIGIVFIILTFAPVHIPLFEDRMTRTYGLEV